MKQVLIIGGNGFIGSHLVDIFLENNINVKVLSRNEEKFRKPIKKVDYIIGDYGNISVLTQAIKNCDTIIHLAHDTNPGSSLLYPYNELLENTTRFVRFLELVKYKSKRIILFSSGGVVYGNPLKGEDKFNENRKLMPISPYGVTKVTMENYLYMYHHNYNLPYFIIRPSNAYGEREDFRRNQGIIPIFIKKILLNEPIEIWGDGSTIRDYIYVKDLVKAVFLLCQNNSVPGIYNIGSGVGTQINQVLSYIQLALNLEYDQIFFTKKRSFDVSNIVLNNKKIKTAIDWETEVTLEKGILLTLDWVRQHLDV